MLGRGGAQLAMSRQQKEEASKGILESFITDMADIQTSGLTGEDRQQRMYQAILKPIEAMSSLGIMQPEEAMESILSFTKATMPEALTPAKQLADIKARTILGDPQLLESDIAQETGVLTQRQIGQEESKLRQLQFSNSSALRKEFNSRQLVKDFDVIDKNLEIVESALESFKKNSNDRSRNFLDQALIIPFNKTLDPGSVVRESEYARTSEGLSLINRLEGLYDKYKRGGAGLNDSERIEAVRIMKVLRNAALTKVQPVIEEFVDLAKKNDFDPKDIVSEKFLNLLDKDKSPTDINKDITKNLNEEEKQALEWANDNPDDPRASEIKRVLGVL